MPVLLGQALYLRMTVLNLPEPPGARSGVVGDGEPLRLLVIGDSSAAGVGVDTQDQALCGQLSQLLSEDVAVHFDLVAETGAKTGQTLGWLSGLPKQQYDFVVTALGVNDVTKGVSLRTWLRQQNQLIDHLSTQFGAKRIYVSGLPPMAQFPLLPQPLRWILGRQADRFDRNLEALTKQRSDCEMIRIDLGLDKSNMAADGFHPGPTVYAAWAKEIADRIKADLHLLDESKGAT